MDRHISNKGFMLAEVCLVILALAMLSSLYLSMHEIDISDFYSFKDQYLYEQSEALKNGESRIFEGGGTIVEFNENGNIRQARTLSFKDHQIIIELGGGRLVFP